MRGVQRVKRRRLGSTQLDVSPVMFGAIILNGETESSCRRHVGEAVDRGVNYFDVAPSYGEAEERLGPALEPYRQQAYLACKTLRRDGAGARAELEQSLKVLRTDHFDVYQLHALSSLEDVRLAFAPGGAMETLVSARQSGEVRYIGFSAHSEQVAMAALAEFPFDTVLFPMNWALGLTAGWGDRVSAAALRQQFGLLCMKTLVHRKWLPEEERDFPKSWCKPIWNNTELAVAAMKYGFHKGGASMVPPGNIFHFRFALDHIDECLAEPLSLAELDFLRGEAAKVRGHLIFAPEAS